MTDADPTNGDDDSNSDIDGASANKDSDGDAADSTVSVPADLTAVALITLLMSVAVALPVVRSTLFRSVLTVPFVLFVPGYAIVAALFSEAGAPSPARRRTGRRVPVPDSRTSNGPRCRSARAS